MVLKRPWSLGDCFQLIAMKSLTRRRWHSEGIRWLGNSRWLAVLRMTSDGSDDGRQDHGKLGCRRECGRENMHLTTQALREAERHLQQVDPVMSRLIGVWGPCRLRRRRNRFAMLARSVISQQISTKAAQSIQRRLSERIDGQWSAERMHALDLEDLRGAGVSPQKAGYLQDLTRLVLDGTLNLNQIGRLNDEQVISRLIQVRGIGRWTAQMFLMFALARPDVFPDDDLGIRRGIERLYGLPPDCERQRYHDVARRWSPYCTVACWYCWRSGESPPKGKSSRSKR